MNWIRFGLSLVLIPPSLGAETLVNFGDDWRFFKGIEEASDPLDAWRGVESDDDDWHPGKAPFRYGDGEGGTVLSDMEDRYTTLYLRKLVVLENPESFSTLELGVDYDDGFALWINDRPVWRRNAPDSLAHDSLATSNHESGSVERSSIPDADDFLRPGMNVIAVQVFNVSLGSSDCFFDLEIRLGLPVLEEPLIRMQSGFYEKSFFVEITPPNGATVIRYTTDGSAPSADGGEVYEHPIEIDQTTVLRAVALAPDRGPSRAAMRTYLFLTQVVHQTAQIPGWPQPELSIGQGRRLHDYGMDARIVRDPKYAAQMIPALQALPTLSLAVAQEDMWDEQGEGGFYRTEVEKPVGLEVVYPGDLSRNEQGWAGIQGHSHDRMKRSLRLKFRREYGDGKFDTQLLKDAPRNRDTAPDRFDRLVLRGGNNRSWARSWNPDKTAYTFDQWYRDSQIAMSGFGSHGAFVHLYINGLYWGLYNVVERPDTWFAAEHFGGDEEDWFAISHGGEQGGDPVRWQTLTEELAERDLSDPEVYAQFQTFLDVNAFIDYLLLSWYINVTDWPQNNWWAHNQNAPAGPVRFFAWDGEWAFGLGASPGKAWVHPDFLPSSGDSHRPLVKLWHAARRNRDFMMRVADRAFQHLFQGGALDDDPARSRWHALNEAVRMAVIAESARWGDVVDPRNPRTRDEDWQNEVDRIDRLLPGNNVILRDELRRAGYYPEYDPPSLSRPGGAIASGTIVELTSPNSGAPIYYTLDDSDPRLAGGALHSLAIPYTTPIIVRESLSLKARVHDQGEWSALQSAVYITDLPSLQIVELMYHPPEPTAAERAAGLNQDDDFEFLEVANVGGDTVDLGGLHFEDGIQFTFPEISLAPGEGAVIVSNLAAFSLRYGEGRPVVGTYTGRLDNDGERVMLVGAWGEVIDDFTFHDAWQPQTDGAGWALTRVEPGRHTTGNEPAHWRRGTQFYGTPGIIEGGSPVVLEMIRQPSHRAQLRIGGDPGQRIALQRSPDLTQWTDQLELVLDQVGVGYHQLSSERSTAHAQHYYRAVLVME